jgi:hypothetical protein
MQRLLSFLLPLVFIALLAGAGSFYLRAHPTALTEFSLAAPCSAPTVYKVGTIDPRFTMSTVVFATHLKEAADLWNTAAGKPVLSYDQTDPKAIPVNLIYDTRQEAVTVGQKIDSTEASQSNERAAIQAAQQKHLADEQAYADAVAAFNAASQRYAQEVQTVNASGGADKATYARLQTEQASLKEQQAQLKAQGDALSQEAADIQSRVAAFNQTVHQINQAVNTFNATVGGDFEEGEYVRDSTGAQHIDIYAFKSQSELLHTLAHEFGHALGLEHNQNPASIMFPYNKSGVTLSADDIAALKQVCKL